MRQRACPLSFGLHRIDDESQKVQVGLNTSAMDAVSLLSSLLLSEIAMSSYICLKDWLPCLDAMGAGAAAAAAGESPASTCPSSSIHLHLPQILVDPIALWGPRHEDAIDFPWLVNLQCENMYSD